MKLGLYLGYSGAKLDLPVDTVLEAERLGWDSVWTAEAYGSDAVTPLAYLAALTKRIKLGTAIMQIPARTPAMTAMTAMTLDALSGGPFGLTVFSLVVVSLAAAVGERNLFRAARFLPYITIFLATGLFYGVFLFMAQMTGRALPWGPALWRVALPAMVINTAFMPLVYTLAHALSRRLAPPTVEWS